MSFVSLATIVSKVNPATFSLSDSRQRNATTIYCQKEAADYIIDDGNIAFFWGTHGRVVIDSSDKNEEHNKRYEPAETIGPNVQLLFRQYHHSN